MVTNNVVNEPTAASGKVLQGQGVGTASAFSTATYPATTTANQILYSSASNVVGQITAAANGVLVTDGSSVPAISNAGTSWTPTIVGSTGAGTATYSNQTGSYFRIGPFVLATWALTWTVHTGTGNMLVATLPVAPATTAGLRFVTACLTNTFVYPALTTYVVAQIAGDVSTSNIFIQAVGTGAVAAVVPMAAAGQLNGTILYLAA